MPDIVKAIFAIAMVVLGLGMVIFLHEAGHFIMAKKNKVRVEIFSLGFGPAIWSFQRGETEYRLSWVPLGGYVKMSGENKTISAAAAAFRNSFGAKADNEKPLESENKD